MAIREGIADLTRRKKYQFNFFRVGSILVSGITQLPSAVIDVPNQFAYFGANTNPGRVIKVNLSTFTIASTLTLNSGELGLTSAVIESGFAYFGCNTNPRGIVAKVNLTTFSEVSGPVVFLSGEGGLTSAVIDTPNRLAYFGTSLNINNTDNVVKVDLSTFTRLSSVTLNSGESSLACAVIESGIAYFGGTIRPTINRINLATFTEISGNLSLIATFPPRTAVIDTFNRFAYFGGGTTLNRINKVNLSTFTIINTIFATVDSFATSSVMDQRNAFAYFGTLDSIGRVVKVNLSNFTSIYNDTTNTLILNSGDLQLPSAVTDGSFMYIGTNLSNPGQIVKVAIV